MALDFNKRIIGYGAWNLHFDKDLGAEPASDGLTFLSYLRAWGYYKVNHIKVVLFRKSTAEGLPEGRARTLYKPDGTINQVLIDNLKRLVNEAAANGFWVQICIWHHHAIATEDRSEYPENAPAILAPNWGQPNDGLRLRMYYSPVGREAVFAEHRKLFRKIGAEFGSYSNVIFELGNELRVWQSSAGDEGKMVDERNLRSWLQSMLAELRGAAPNPIRVCCSTGIDNENLMFRPGALAVDFFDFHAGQWNMSDKFDNDYPIGIRQSRERVQGYKAGAKLLIDADGLFGGESFQTSGTFAQYMERWATEAFRRGESFITKGYYPPAIAISRPMLDSLERASNAVPE